jgi:hypothetical protein
MELLKVRLYSPDYTFFLLKIYACLRDGNAVKFDNLTMYRPMIQDLLDKAGTNNGGGGGGDNKNNANANREAVCSQCKSRKVHELMGVGHSFGNCPFKTNCDRKQARAAGKHFVAALDANPQADKAEAIKAAIAAAKSTD